MSISYTANCLQADETYTADCVLTGNGPNGAGKGRRVVKFTTKSNLQITSSISPTTGNEFTDFTLDIQVTHDYGSSCYLGYIDPYNYYTTHFGNAINIGANGAVRVTNQNLMSMTYADGKSSIYTLTCYSKVTEDVQEVVLGVEFTPYTGSDLATLQSNKVDALTTSITAINFTSAGQSASSQATTAIGDLLKASSGFAAATAAASEQIIDFMGEALDNLDFDQDDKVAGLVVESIIAIGELIDENIKPNSVLKMANAIETMFIGKTARRNLQIGTSFDDVIGIKQVSEESIPQMTAKE